jgi:hypothetical protein
MPKMQYWRVTYMAVQCNAAVFRQALLYVTGSSTGKPKHWRRANDRGACEVLIDTYNATFYNTLSILGCMGGHVLYHTFLPKQCNPISIKDERALKPIRERVLSGGRPTLLLTRYYSSLSFASCDTI